MRAVFVVFGQFPFGQQVRICGSVPPFGDWDPSKALNLNCVSTGNAWAIEVELPTATTVEYKYVVVVETTGQLLEWEQGENRRLLLLGHTEIEVFRDVFRGVGFTGSRIDSPLGNRTPRVVSRMKRGTFYVTSYNVLAACYAYNPDYPHCPVWAFVLDARYPRIIAELLELDSDVLCLQEVEPYFFKAAEIDLSHFGYKGFYLKKPTDLELEGVAIYYRARKFDCLERIEISLNDLADRACAAAGVDAYDFRLIKNYVALVVVLRSREVNGKPARPFAVCTTHMNWDWKMVDVQALHCALLMREVHGIARDRGGMPCVITGDFGLSPNSAAYNLLSTGKLADKFIAHLRSFAMAVNSKHLVDVLRDLYAHPIASLRSAYPVLIEKEPEFTAFDGKSPACHDYIWFTSDALEVTSILDFPPANNIRRYVGCPNAVFPSDHLSLKTGFRFAQTSPHH
eukprot:TRINITY_DN2817_c0_g1_i2.p1 TRINITY_DN2817_c0_g1~~TRINITY_DN2817_c0_g1_i2.p1  ORF type:complete len:455 (+),score=142.97 TRINITY_DN2817_c0_g1_i2:292-1656(+)